MASGCTAVQLRKDTVGEATAVHDLVQQQVLDNLAMFVHDPNSMPYFSYANQGGAQVTDQASANATAGGGRVNMFGVTPTFPYSFPFGLGALA